MLGELPQKLGNLVLEEALPAFPGVDPARMAPSSRGCPLKVLSRSTKLRIALIIP